tara:strand:+ start:255 stop:389 length:135 start_codon:yes stop_codon:yes gene_type:complete
LGLGAEKTVVIVATDARMTLNKQCITIIVLAVHLFAAHALLFAI